MICAWTETSTADTGSSATIKAGLTDERPGDADPLALAAAEVARIAIGVVGTEPDEVEQREHAVVDFGARADRDGRASASASIWRTVMRGFSEE